MSFFHALNFSTNRTIIGRYCPEVPSRIKWCVLVVIFHPVSRSPLARHIQMVSRGGLPVQTMCAHITRWKSPRSHLNPRRVNPRASWSSCFHIILLPSVTLIRQTPYTMFCGSLTDLSSCLRCSEIFATFFHSIHNANDRETAAVPRAK